MSLRFRLADFLDRAGVLEAALRARGRLGLPFLTVLTYHRVGKAENEADGEVVDATAEELDAHLSMLRGHFSLIGVSELHAHFAHRAPLPPNPCLITFDDGYRDCLTRALPVLRKHRARAVFFVASSFPDAGKLYWWDKIAVLVGRSRRPRLRLDYPGPLDLDRSSPKAAMRALQRVVKSTAGLDLDRFLDELSRAADVALPRAEEASLASRLLMGWDDLRELRRAGMDVESHTRSHRVLQTVPRGELRDELEGSREELEAQLRAPVRAIAYPVGSPVRGDVSLSAEIKRAGYSLGFSNGTGLSFLGPGADPLDLRRVAVESALPRSYLRAAMSLPLFAHTAPAEHRASRHAAPHLAGRFMSEGNR